MAKTETTLTIQSFHQCSSLISLKVSSSNYLLWKSQVLPLVRSLGIENHLTENKPPEKEIKDKDGEATLNPSYVTWINNDGLLTSWLLGIISEEVLSMIEGMESVHQVWSSVEDILLSITKENEIHINESVHCLKKGNLSLEEYIKKFKALSDKLAAMKKPLDDITKVFTLARGLGTNYKDFKTTMLSKAPYPTFNQFILALKAHEQMNQIEVEEEKSITPNHNQAFYSQRGRGRGRGRYFSSRGRGFQPT